jgi:hypothetical protein
MDWMGFAKEIFTMVKLLFQDARTTIHLNGSIFPSFDIRHGVR